MIYLVIAMQALDAWSTWQGFRLRGAVEANPIVAALIFRLGLFWGLAVAKGIAVVAVLTGQSYGAWNGDGKYLLWAIAALYVWVLWNNLRILYGNPRS